MRTPRVICLLAGVLIAVASSCGAYAASLGRATAVTTEGRYASAVWSPAGGGLALGGERGRGLYSMDMTGQMSIVSESPLSGWGFNWSPDGRSLAYRAQDENGDVAMMLSDGRGNVKQLTPYMDGGLQTAWTKDGLTYKAGDEIVTVDAKGKVKSTRSLSQGRGMLTRIMSVSGSLVAARVTGASLTALPSLFKAGAASDAKAANQVFVDTESKVWIVDENGNQRKLIDVEGVKGYASPVASPQVGRYAVHGFDDNLYVADINGSGPVNLGEGSNPTWSPDGRYLIYTVAKDDGEKLTSSELWMASPDGSWKSQITNDGSIKESPSWSPDGKQISYIVDGVVYVAPLEM